MLDRLLRALLPRTCLLCELPLGAASASRPDLCEHCLAALPWNTGACRQCALPLPAGATERCPTCEWFPPPWSRAVVPLVYADEVTGWVHRLKDHLGLVEARTLGQLLADAAAGAYTADTPPDFLVPVPLTWRRLAARGHNQALALALPVGRRLGIPVARTGARRVRHTRRQRGLPADQRSVNLLGAFATRRDWRGCRIGIVDDVLTTGATATELAHVLLDAGASEVHVLCAARAVRAAAPRPLP